MWRAHSFMISIKCRTKAFSMGSFSKWRYSHFFNVKRSLLFIKCRFLHVALFCKRSMSVYALNNLCMCLYCIRWSHGVIIFHMLSFSTHFYIGVGAQQPGEWQHTHTQKLWQFTICINLNVVFLCHYIERIMGKNVSAADELNMTLTQLDMWFLLHWVIYRQ